MNILDIMAYIWNILDLYINTTDKYSPLIISAPDKISSSTISPVTTFPAIMV